MLSRLSARRLRPRSGSGIGFWPKNPGEPIGTAAASLGTGGRAHAASLGLGIAVSAPPALWCSDPNPSLDPAPSAPEARSTRVPRARITLGGALVVGLGSVTLPSSERRAAARSPRAPATCAQCSTILHCLEFMKLPLPKRHAAARLPWPPATSGTAL